MQAVCAGFSAIYLSRPSPEEEKTMVAVKLYAAMENSEEGGE